MQHVITAAAAAELIFNLFYLNGQRLNGFFYFFIQFIDGISDHLSVVFFASKQQRLDVLLMVELRMWSVWPMQISTEMLTL